MSRPDPLAKLIEQLQRLPGIGAKSAQRLAFHILKTPREDVDRLIITAGDNIYVKNGLAVPYQGTIPPDPTILPDAGQLQQIHYAEAWALVFDGRLGSDYDYAVYTADVRAYRSVGRQVLAVETLKAFQEPLLALLLAPVVWVLAGGAIPFSSLLVGVFLVHRLAGRAFIEGARIPQQTADALPDVALTSSCLANTGTYSLTHLGDLVDATRYIGTLDVGECSWQYWSFSYPRRSNPDTCGSPVWCATNDPNDDLWLPFDAWGTSAQGAAANTTWRVHADGRDRGGAQRSKPGRLHHRERLAGVRIHQHQRGKHRRQAARGVARVGADPLQRCHVAIGEVFDHALGLPQQLGEGMLDHPHARDHI